MGRSQTCPCCEKRPISVSVSTCKNGVRIRVDLCSACWLERCRPGELPDEKAETEKLEASVDQDVECDVSA